LIATWKKANPIIEDALVVDVEQTWDYFVDLGDKNDTVKGEKKASDPNAKNAYDHRAEFQDDEAHKHSMYFKAGKGQATIIVQSDPINIDELLSKAIKKASGEEKAVLDGILARKNALLKYIKDNTDDLGKPNESNMSKELSAHIESELNSIGADLKSSGVLTDVPLPLSKVTHAMSGGKPYQVVAEPLSIFSGNTTGSGKNEDPVGWDLVENFKYGNYYVDDDGSHKRMTPENEEHVKHMNYKIIFKPDSWIRFHILSEKLHGPGVHWNLLSSSSKDNTNFESQIEEPVKTQITESAEAPLFYDVKVTEWRSEIPFTAEQDSNKEAVEGIKAKYGESYKKLPKKIVVDAGYLKKGEGDNYVKDDAKAKIHDNAEYSFNDDIDVTVEPGQQVIMIANQGEVNNAALGISLGFGRFLKANRGSLSSVSQLVDKLLEDGTMSIDTVVNYLNELKGALALATPTKLINFIDKNDGGAVSGDLTTYLTKLDEVVSSAPSMDKLRALKAAKKLTNKNVHELYSKRVGTTIEVKGITLLIPSLSEPSIALFFSPAGPLPKPQVAHLLMEVLQ